MHALLNDWTPRQHDSSRFVSIVLAHVPFGVKLSLFLSKIDDQEDWSRLVNSHLFFVTADVDVQVINSSVCDTIYGNGKRQSAGDSGEANLSRGSRRFGLSPPRLVITEYFCFIGKGLSLRLLLKSIVKRKQKSMNFQFV